ncbi:hemolysin family protein [Wenxinia saemankumensis]|uniref:Putative hemolysin n=1 Tax=Wenxinia saemankumensis TaxID=1447782 RepID=A0A1M6B3J1_9RHOB|nr:hemolysin family protein [Wenxinia saemankumensis]SHI43023.1 putative hemolysin [Wenxinia saemankumensis]
MIVEIVILLLLILLNGFLAMSELAVVSARPARLKVMAERGSRGASAAMRLAGDPGRFLSSVQIGITLVGVLSGAFSGATLGVRLADALVAAGAPEGAAGTLGVGSVVVVITYLSLIVGELVPKQIALRAPEAVAARVAPAMILVARVSAPFVWLLDRSGKAVLALLGQSGRGESGLSDEEVRLVISEARQAGVIKHAETEMIEGVMRVADRTARGLMTPRHEVELVDLADGPAAVMDRFRTTRRSRLPVRDGEADDIVGVLATRDVIASGPAPDLAGLRALVEPATIVRDGMPALDVIETLKRAKAHMVLVFDEYGHFEGVITAMDLLQAIAGDFLEGETPEPKIVAREDGSLLVAGWMPVDEFAARVDLALPDDRAYETVAGLILDHLGTLPDVGETMRIGGLGVEILDLDGRRIDKVLVTRAAPPG